MDFEINDVAPAREPLIQQLRIVCFHELIAALKRRVHPTGYVQKAPVARAVPGLESVDRQELRRHP